MRRKYNANVAVMGAPSPRPTSASEEEDGEALRDSPSEERGVKDLLLIEPSQDADDWLVGIGDESSRYPK
jgi:hypothetical protein